MTPVTSVTPLPTTPSVTVPMVTFDCWVAEGLDAESTASDAGSPSCSTIPL